MLQMLVLHVVSNKPCYAMLLVTCVILYMCWSTVTTEVEAMFVSSGVSFGQLLGWCGTSYNW